MEKDLPMVEINNKKYMLEDFEKDKSIDLREVNDKYNNTLSIRISDEGVLMTAFSELIGDTDGVYYTVRLRRDNQNSETYQYSNEGYIDEWKDAQEVINAYDFIQDDISNLRETEKIMKENEAWFEEESVKISQDKDENINYEIGKEYLKKIAEAQRQNEINNTRDILKI